MGASIALLDSPLVAVPYEILPYARQPEDIVPGIACFMPVQCPFMETLLGL